MPLTKVKSLGITDGAVIGADIADGSVTAAKLAAGVGGKVLQVVQGTTTTIQNTSSTSFTDVLNGASTWETSITPATSGNKILVMPTIKIGGGFGGTSESRATIITQMKIGGGSYSDFITESAQNSGSYDYGGSGILVYVYYGLTKLYTTSSTSTHTFKFRVKTEGGTISVNQGSGSNPSFLTLFEIAS